jgi:hypothetical protein
MKQIGLACVLVLGLILPGCGGNSSPKINGTWFATLTNSDGTTNATFAAAFTNFSFTTLDPCIGSQNVTESGTFTSTTGNFTMTIFGPGPAPPVLGLQGTLSNGTITGAWTRSLCPGNGTLTIKPVMQGG